MLVGAAQGRDAASGTVDSAEQEAGERMSGLLRKSRHVRLNRREVEVSGTVLVSGLQKVPPVLITETERVRAGDIGQVVLEDIASVEPFSCVAGTDLEDVATLPLVAAEIHPREVGVRSVLDTDPFGPALVHIHGLVTVTEAVIATGEPVQQVRRQG